MLPCSPASLSPGHSSAPAPAPAPVGGWICFILSSHNPPPRSLKSREEDLTGESTSSRPGYNYFSVGGFLPHKTPSRVSWSCFSLFQTALFPRVLHGGLDQCARMRQGFRILTHRGGVDSLLKGHLRACERGQNWGSQGLGSL